MDSEPSITELNEALDSLALGRTPGKDNMAAEVRKCCKGIVTTELQEIFCLCWREGGIPQDMKDANIVTLYKSKGDRGDCNNYCGISLLSVLREAEERDACPCHTEEAPSAAAGGTV